MRATIRVYGKIKPILHTFLFEVSRHIKKFIIFSILMIIQLFWFNYYMMYARESIPSQIDWFYYQGTHYSTYIMIFAVCFFFSGIICAEYKDKTGLTILPLITKYKLLIGKYCANVFLVVGIATVNYLMLVLLGYSFYGELLITTWIRSYGFSVLYIFALGSFVTFLSSLLSSSAKVIVITLGFTFIEFLELGINPIFSFASLQKTIQNLPLLIFFTDARYYMNIEGAIAVLLVYTILFFVLATLFFKRREQ
jgi:ABC-type transport system involved in multi-copper enzyme maturation permease subunit